MARVIEVKVKGDTKQLDRDIESAARRGERAFAQGRDELGRFTKSAADADRSIRQMSSSLGGLRTAFAALGGASVFTGIAKASIDAAVAIDKQLSSLKALTGSAEAAQKRFQELFRLAQRTPGLTTSLAATLDAQLRIFSVAERTIDRLLPVIGRLNAISPLGDPRQFINNLTQLITQNFERQDLKELVGQSPIAGRLIAQIFNVDNPTNAEAIRKAAKQMGVTTVARLAEELIKASESNSALKNAQDTLASQFEKMRDRINIALAPIGEELLKTILPSMERLIRMLEQDGPKAVEVVKVLGNEFNRTAGQLFQVVDYTSQFVSLITQLDSKTGFLGWLQSALNLLNPIAVLLDSIRRAQGAIQGGANTPPAPPDGRAITPGNVAFARFGQRDFYAGRMGSLPGTGSLVEYTEQQLRRRTTGTGTATASRARRTFPTPSASDLVSSQYEGLDDFNATEAARFAGRIRRAELTAALDASEGSERLRQDRLTRAALTEDFERQEAAIKKAEEAMRKYGAGLSDSERFMRGFASAVETTGDAFERLGVNIASSFRDVGNLLSNLKRSLLQFFNDLLGAGLQNIMGQILAPIFGGGRGGGGGLFGNIFSGGGSVLTGGFAGGNPAGSILGGGLGNLFRGGGSAGSAVGAGPQAAARAGGLFGGFSLSGIGQSFGDVAPLLGGLLGAGLGGQSTGGKILGGIGGLLGSTFISTTLGAPGALGSLAPALFSNPLTAIAGAGLLVGAVLLGRASQRRKDEQASGEYLTQALQAIDALAEAVSTDRITSAAEAKGIFDRDIIGTFTSQINQLKTKSVRESRLTNQVRDLRNVYEARIPPLFAEQAERRKRAEAAFALDTRLIPEFAVGGRVPGAFNQARLILAHGGELIVNPTQQTPELVAAASRAGVPGAGRGQDSGQPVVNVTFVLGTQEQSEIFVNGLKQQGGERALRAKLAEFINYG